ncbi:MAG TPA: SRPBCC family protein [Mycobacteriales bacterium]|jgi:uncharacterized protein YndB with AHSA1/START domain|nr:SRPBCC family protein [Mycobacteriales bacterium]
MPSTYDVRVSCKAPKEKVFALVADATTWSRWAKPYVRFGKWVTEGDPAPGGVGAVRRLGTKAWGMREQIIEFDAPHYLAYTILTPSPVKDYRAVVSVDSEGEGSRITWAATFEGRFPGAGPGMAFLMRRVIGRMATGLARYAETAD